MCGDLCYHCDGTGERDFLSGAACRECGGTGWREETEDDGLYFEECVTCLCEFLTDGIDDECLQCRARMNQ